MTAWMAATQTMATVHTTHVSTPEGPHTSVVVCAGCGTRSDNDNEHTLHQSEVALEAIGITERFTIAWDGDPSMSGRPHTQRTGAEMDRSTAEQGVASGIPLNKTNRRVESRLATDWAPLEWTPTV